VVDGAGNRLTIGLPEIGSLRARLAARGGPRRRRRRSAVAVAPEWPRGARSRGGHGLPHGAAARVPRGASRATPLGARAGARDCAFEPNKRIVIEWDGYSGRITVEWKFAPHGHNSTFVSISESGWTGSGDELVKYATNSTQGFTWTLAGLKALLEHNFRLNLVADRFPRGPGEPYPDE
jgi:hypothetical protein